MPSRSTPRAALVVVHGAGERPARYTDWAQIYATAGLAVLIYDKRGCGKSGGVYVGPLNTSAPNLRLLTGDAVAAGRGCAGNLRPGA